MIELIDTHCHIQDADLHDGDVFIQEKWRKGGFDNSSSLIERAVKDGVSKLLCVGTTLENSERAVKLAGNSDYCWGSIGIHPHEAKDYVDNPEKLQQFHDLAKKSKLVAVGECGLDYYYEHSPKDAQKQLLKTQIELALAHNLPLIFHVREAFDDFWSIFDSYQGIKGVVHSFSATEKELQEALERGLYIGLNGIMTFTKDEQQLLAAKSVPQDRLVLETDAPFLTPVPFRGKICEPKHVRTVAEFLAELRGETLEQIADATTANARTLFGI